MSTKTIKFLFCFVIYVILFIAVSFYPDQTIVAIPIADTLFEFVSIPTFFHSCLLTPFVGTANYIKMDYQNPFVTYETFVISDEQLEESAKNYVEYIKNISK